MADLPLVQGPSNFTVQKPAPVQVSVPLASNVARSGVRPVEAVRQSPVSDHRQAMDRLAGVQQETMRALSGFGGVIAEKLKEAQEAEFADGYMRHMQGESVASIAEQQPFGDLFGDGAAVRGARARQQETAGQSIMQWVQQNRGELSRMPLDEQRLAVGQYISELGTGDQVADTLISQGAMKMMPAVLDNLARAGEEENQRNAQIQQADSMAAAGESLKYARSQFETGQMSPENYATLKANYLSMATPLPGQSGSSYRAALTGQIMQLSRDGSHEMAQLLYDDVLQGDLLPEERIQMEAQMKAGQADWLLNNPSSYDHTAFRTTLGSQISGGRYTTQAELEDDIDIRNADYKAQTGSLTPLIDNKEKSQRVSDWLDYKQRADAQSAKLMAGAQDEATKRGLYMEAYAKGSPSGMAAAGLDKPTAAALEANESAKFFQGSPESSQVLGKLAVNGYTNAPVKEYLSAQMGVIQGGGIPKPEHLQRMQAAFEQLRSTPYGMGAVEAYFGDDTALVERMAGMDMTDKGNVQAIREMAAAAKHKTPVSKEVQTKADDMVNSEYKPGFISRLFGDGQQLGAGYEAQLKDEYKKHVADVMAQYPNWTDDNVLKAAQARLMKGKDIAGNMVVSGGQPGQFLKGLNQHLNVKIADPKDTRINSIINDSIKSKVPNDMGYNVGALSMLPDGNTVVATVMRDNGGQQSVVLRLSDVAGLANKSLQTKVAKARSEEVKPAGMTQGYVAEAQRQQQFRDNQKR